MLPWDCPNWSSSNLICTRILNGFVRSTKHGSARFNRSGTQHANHLPRPACTEREPAARHPLRSPRARGPRTEVPTTVHRASNGVHHAQRDAERAGHSVLVPRERAIARPSRGENNGTSPARAHGSLGRFVVRTCG
jgi:hypothetical protein